MLAGQLFPPHCTSTCNYSQFPRLPTPNG